MYKMLLPVSGRHSFLMPLTLGRPTCQSWHIKVFTVLTAQRELLYQNGEKMSDLAHRAPGADVVSGA